jgi:outer membrane protein TolC
MVGSGRRKTGLEIAAAVLALILPLGVRAQISLSTAVALAEKNSPSVRAAAAGVWQARAGLSQSKNVYYPSFSLGSSVGPPPYGFPLGNPDIYDVDAQSLVFSFSQLDYIRAAHAGLRAALLNLKDAQQQVTLDVALDYVELDYDLKEIAALDQEKAAAEQLAGIEQQRVAAGVDPRVSQLRAQLVAAQVDEKRIHLESDADEMRQKISHLTGLPGEGLETIGSSIPPASVPNANADSELRASNAGLAAQFASAQSKYFTAFGDERQDHRPWIGFGLKYQRFAKFQNFQNYYHNFQQNNVSAGILLTIPIFDSSLRAKAQASAADAERAEAQAEQSQIQVSEATLQMRDSVRELTAQQRVAQIQEAISQEQLKSLRSELTNGSGSPTGPAATPIQARQAEIDERERYADVLDANFALMKAELNLMRATGQINSWVQSSLNNPAGVPGKMQNSGVSPQP